MKSLCAQLKRLQARFKRRCGRHAFDAQGLEATKADTSLCGSIVGVPADASDAAGQIHDKKESHSAASSSCDDNQDEEAAIDSPTTAPKSTAKPMLSLTTPLQAAPDETLAQEEPTMHHSPGMMLVSRLVVVADILVGIRLIETYGSYVDAEAIPHRLKYFRFDWAEYTLDPALSWEEVATIVKKEQQGYKPFGSPNLRWLSLVDEAAKWLGIAERHLRDEIVAYAPSKRRLFAYSPTGISDMIAKKHWSPLAKRLSQDRALVPFAFPREPASAAAFVACIKRLEREHFEWIALDPKGALMAYQVRGEGHECNDDDDVEAHVEEGDYPSYASSEG